MSVILISISASVNLLMNSGIPIPMKLKGMWKQTVLIFIVRYLECKQHVVVLKLKQDHANNAVCWSKGTKIRNEAIALYK